MQGETNATDTAKSAAGSEILSPLQHLNKRSLCEDNAHRDSGRHENHRKSSGISQ
jgi:hypothetical protein